MSKLITEPIPEPPKETPINAVSTKDFVPSINLIEFTDFVIKKSLDNDHFHFNIFPFFMTYLIPFQTSAKCIEKIDVKFNSETEYRDYSTYFKTLFNYHKLLNDKQLIQSNTFALFKQLIALANNSLVPTVVPTTTTTTTPTTNAPTTNAPTTNAPTTDAPATSLKQRTDLIAQIQTHLSEITIIDKQVLIALKQFDSYKNDECNDLHSFFLGFTTPDKVIPNTDTSTNSSIQKFIDVCVKNIDKSDILIDVSTLYDDPPEMIFKKLVLLICNSYADDTSFNNAKFWLISQLFTRL